MFATSSLFVSCIFIQNVYMFEVPLEVELFDGYDINVGSALFLTPLIQKGKIAEAQNASRVNSFLNDDNDVSYSGFLTVDEKKESNLHFWFFPAKQNWTRTSTVVWLHSGTGVSSIEGLFTANGPYGLNSSSIVPRKFSWNDYFNLLYMDCPVGTGYSFTKHRNGYSKSARDVAENAAEGLHQFFQLFPQINRRKLILSGQSLAGQFIPYLAYFLHDSAYRNKYNATVSRISVGNPTINLGSEDMYSDHYSKMGLIGEAEKEKLRKIERLIKLEKQGEKFGKAADIFCRVFCQAYTHPYPTLFENFTGLNQNSNLLRYSNEVIDLSQFLNDPSTREKLHVGNIKWKKDRSVFDILKPALLERPKIDLGYVFRNRIKTLIYVGQADLVVPPIAMDRALATIPWRGARDFDYSVRTQMFYNEKLVGYQRSSNDVVSVVVRNAGHDAAADRPGYVRAILKDFEAGVFDDKYDEGNRD